MENSQKISVRRRSLFVLPGKPSFQEFFKMRRTRRSGKSHNGYTSGPLSNVAFDWGEHEEKMIDLDTVEWCEKIMEKEKASPRFLAAGIFKPHLPFYAPRDTFAKYLFDIDKHKKWLPTNER